MKAMEHQMIHDLNQDEQRVDRFIECEYGDVKMKRNVWKQRGYSVPKHLENFLRKHTGV